MCSQVNEYHCVVKLDRDNHEWKPLRGHGAKGLSLFNCLLRTKKYSLCVMSEVDVMLIDWLEQQQQDIPTWWRRSRLQQRNSSDLKSVSKSITFVENMIINHITRKIFLPDVFPCILRLYHSVLVYDMSYQLMPVTTVGYNQRCNKCTMQRSHRTCPKSTFTQRSIRSRYNSGKKMQYKIWISMQIKQ